MRGGFSLNLSFSFPLPSTPSARDSWPCGVVQTKAWGREKECSPPRPAAVWRDVHECGASWQACLENLATHHLAIDVTMPTLCHPLNTEMHRLDPEPSSVHVAGEPPPRVNVVGWSHKKVGNTSRVEDL